MNAFPTPPTPDTRNTLEKLTPEKWDAIQRREVRNVNLLAVTPEQLREAMRKI